MWKKLTEKSNFFFCLKLICSESAVEKRMGTNRIVARNRMYPNVNTNLICIVFNRSSGYFIINYTFLSQYINVSVISELKF